MKNINTLLTKMKTSTSDMITLNDLAPLSLHEIYALSEEKLSWHEAKTLYKEAQKAAKISKINEAHYLARRNPQVQNAVSLGIQSPIAQSNTLENWIPNRDNHYVDSKSVASMFSPAGYLTELYREAKEIGAEGPMYRLDRRRPDLAQLVLSQENMDKEISTLSLSNQILMTALQHKLGNDKDLFQVLATNRVMGENPYHQPYETIRQTLLLRDGLVDKLVKAKDSLDILDTEWISTIVSSISPELYAILTEVISDNNVDELVEKNFGSKDISLKNNLNFLSEYYSIPEEEMSPLFNILKVNNELPSKGMLILNKIVRLHKATGISFDNLIILIKTKNNDHNIDSEVIRSILHVRNTMEKYNINIEQSMVINGANINEQTVNNSSSLFDTLFNSPPLGVVKFIADNKELDFNSSSPDDLIRINTLKRAFHVDDLGIVAMWNLASDKPTKFTCSIENISLLYRVYLLSTVYGIDFYSLSLLLNMLPEPYHKPINQQTSSDDAANLIYTIDKYLKFIKEYKFNIPELYIMTAKKYDLRYTDEMKNLIEELMNIKFADAIYLAPMAIIESYLPIISSYFHLPSLSQGNSIWLTLESTSSLNLTIFYFKDLVKKQDKTQEDKNNIITYIQMLCQMISIFAKVGLNEDEIEILGSEREIGNEYILPDIKSIKDLSDFHHFYMDKISDKNELINIIIGVDRVSILSKIYKVSEDVVNQIISLLKISDRIKFNNIKEIASYIDMVNIFNITPNNFNLLTQLKLSMSSNIEKDYLNWDRVSKILQSGLNTQQALLLKSKMDERESVAFTAFYINQFSELNLLTSDDVYYYLLIDNKVSSEIKTTKIEQAIASIQLYINEFLSLDIKSNTPVKSRQFFIDWDKYNKRYSTWSGVSLLTYYPENYIDPTVRIGQTKMMDTLLQTISQNSINSDTIDDAFKTYLTSFEQIANLDVISGYHDGVTLKDGKTYFIGCNASEKASYYWRSADHSKIKKGVMAANAWTEWTKIENGANPYNNLIRPVIFNNRLYVAWIERKEIENKEEATFEEISKPVRYSLNLSHIRYDGTWSSSIDFQFSDDFIKNEKGNFHLSYDQELDKLYFLTYITSHSYGSKYKEYKVYSVDNEMVFSNILDSEQVENIYINVQAEFDIAGEEFISNINNKFMSRGKVAYSISHDPIDNIDNIYNIDNIESIDASLSGSLMSGVSVEAKNSTLSCYLSAFVNCDINYGHLAPESIKNIFKELLKNGSLLADIVYTFGSVGKVHTNVFNIKTDYSYYFGFDIKTNTAYFFIYDNNKGKVIENSDVNNGSDYNINLFILSKQVGHLLDCSSRNKAAFSLSDELGDLSLQDFLNKETSRFVFYISEAKTNFMIMGKYGKQVSDRLTIGKNELNKIIYSDDDMVEDIQIILSSNEDNDINYSLDEWSNANTSLNEGSNSFNSKNKTLKLDVPMSDFNDNGELILTANLRAVNKKQKVISESTYNFKINKLEHITESVISLKTNQKHAQYMSMTVENKPLLVRLNTLFARQLVKRANKGIDAILTLSSQRLPEPALEKGADVPMDFNGANALYFWELFYYTPMMLANVMLEGQNYDEASRWLGYVFNPNGYTDGNTQTHRVWNSQPLLADIAWDNEQLDSTDPDAVAQTDPMHYKLATFMKCLDILMARGDSAYRLLERDTLNEAKMWYVQALRLLGNETELLDSEVWSAPTLHDAATKTHQSMSSVSEGRKKEATLSRTANTLTSLFLPQINQKLAQYRDMLKARLFNLRHNLSIDGQPLSLPTYATPADPKALQNAAVNQSQGGSTLPNAVMPTQRFPEILNSAKSIVSQLIQFGSSLASIIERQDAQALSELLTTQGSEMILQNVKYQTKNIEEFTYNEKALKALHVGAQNRLDHYGNLYDENISTSEQQAMDLYLASSVLNTASQGLNMAGAIADLVPNIYGLAVGGSRFGAVFNATSIGLQLSGAATRIAADRLNQSEFYRRRRDEWKIARDNAKSELEQINEQLDGLKVRKEAANLQLDSMKLQQKQTQEHLTFLQNKFSNKALYSWLRSKSMAIYKPFYDLVASRCRMAEMAYQYDLGETQTFIRPSAWQGNYSGLMAGESLMHNLTEMESSYLEKDKRVLEITKIVSLEDVYQGLGSHKFGFEQVADVINKSKTQLGTAENGITLKNGQLQASIKLSDLAIGKDYPADLGKLRRVKQISVTLPALTGAYQNIRAVLNYGGSAVKPRGCSAIAISHGMNDSGQFQLNFNDDRYLPFEGLPVDDTSTLTLSFPDATDKQKAMLLTLNDIILHINYTIR